MSVDATRTDLGVLTLPFERIETIHGGNSEVRLYRNELTGLMEVGKRFDTLGVETSVAVLEGSVLQQIRHPYLVPVYSVTQVEEDPRTRRVPEMRPVIEITMPYYRRGSVCDAFSREERFSLIEARDIAVAALHGLAELHTRGILHRDVKTPNIFLMDQEEPTPARLGDLGAAARVTQDGTTEGINAPQLWTPPENYTVGRVSQRSDLYSMGLVLYELIHGPFPYDDYARGDILERLNANKLAPLPRDLRWLPHVPRSLRRVIKKAIRPKPSDRFGSALKMAAEISNTVLIDWKMTRDEDDLKRWEGQADVRGRPRFRISASRKPRLGIWRVSVKKRYSSWRRIEEDHDLEDLDGAPMRRVFDDVLDSVAR